MINYKPFENRSPYVFVHDVTGEIFTTEDGSLTRGRSFRDERGNLYIILSEELPVFTDKFSYSFEPINHNNTLESNTYIAILGSVDLNN